MPLALRLSARLFLTLSKNRDWRIETLALPGASLFGGGKPRVFQSEPMPVPLSTGAVIAYASAWGFNGDLLIETVDDVLSFDEAFLRLSHERAASRIRNMNR